jgi:cytoplasmic iron level regulating protein YaaA (DUF328/UPF0246 family)
MRQTAKPNIENLAANIVYQIGDVLSEAKALDFVGKRQETNDRCIKFVKNIIQSKLKKQKKKLHSSWVKEVRGRFVKLAIENKNVPDELKGLELYAKTLKMFDDILNL